MELSECLRAHMSAAGMSQADLARATNLGSAQIAYLVNGHTNDPRLSTLQKLADALNCSIDDLLNDADVASVHSANLHSGGTPTRPRAHYASNKVVSPAFHNQQGYIDLLHMYDGCTVTPTGRKLSESLKKQLRHTTFDNVSVANLCRDAGMSRRTFYRHFLDKYDLLTWTFYQDLCVRIPHHDDWVSWDYVPAICDIFEEDREFYKHACLVQGPNSLREFASARMFPLALRDFENITMNSAELDTFVERAIGMVYDSIEYWLIEEPDVSAALFSKRFREKMTSLLQRLIDTIKQGPDNGDVASCPETA